MTDYGPLFRSAEASPSAAEATLGVLELNEAIDAALRRGFPREIWVRGEIQGLARTRMRRHWYFELVEKDPRSDQVLAKVSIALLQWNRSGVDRELKAAPGFELEDDLEVRIRCEVSYYAPFGKLQLVMKGIDPAFTLGQMAVNRDRILRQLGAEGLLDRNAARPLPLVPGRIGVVTSIGSAAYNDFVHEIERSGLGLRILACDARVQGAQTESTVISALRSLEARGCDLLVLIRGGGSRSDLAGFDSETIARAIASASVPVWTGIGHEIDHSVADVVAHRAFKTPTAVAAAIVECGEGFLSAVESRWGEIRALAQRRLVEDSSRLTRLATALSSSALGRTEMETMRLGHWASRLRREAAHANDRAVSRLQRRSREVVHLARVRLVGAEAQIRSRALVLSPARLVQLLSRREAQLQGWRLRLIRAAGRNLRLRQDRLDAVALRVRAADPQLLLRRGYSLTYTREGTLVREVGRLRPGTELRTRLAAGEVLSRVESVDPGRNCGEGRNVERDDSRTHDREEDDR